MSRLFFITSLILFITTAGIAQKIKIESLNDLFAGVPLAEEPENWVNHIEAKAYWTFDSIGQRGRYYTLNDAAAHFPFPDSIKVRMLINRKKMPLRPGVPPEDTAKYILIEGIFGDGKNAKKASKFYYKQIKNLVSGHYKKNKYLFTEDLILFSQGVNDRFPNLLIHLEYSEELKFYAVVLMAGTAELGVQSISP